MPPTRSRDTLLYTLIAAAYFYPLAIRGVDAHHDGLMMKTAWDVASGQILFRETFAQYGPLTALIHAGSLLVFGKSLFALRIVTWIALAITAGLLGSLWNRFLPRRWTALAIGIWILLAPEAMKSWTFMPWSSVLALPSLIAMILCWLNAEKNRAYAVFAGIFAAVVFWTRTPVGVFMTAAVFAAEAAFYFRSREKIFIRRRILFFTLGLILMHGLFAGTLASAGLFAPWFEQCIGQPARWAAERGNSIPAILRVLFLIDTGAFADAAPAFPAGLRLLSLACFGCALFLPIAMRTPSRSRSALIFIFFSGAAAANWELFRTSEGWGFWLPFLFFVAGIRARDTASRFFTLLAIASWLQVYPIPCPRHIFWAVTPGVGLAAVYLKEVFHQSRRDFILLALFLIAPLALSRAMQYRQKIGLLNESTSAPALRGMLMTAEEARRYDRVTEIIDSALRANPDAPMLLFGEDALLLVWAHRLENAHPYFVLWPQMQWSAEDLAKRAEFIARKNPLILVQESGKSVSFPKENYRANPLSMTDGTLWTPTSNYLK